MTQEEKTMFQTLAVSKDGQTLSKYIEKLIARVVDSRNIQGNVEVEVRARAIVAEMLQENFIERLKVLRGETPVENEDYS